MDTSNINVIDLLNKISYYVNIEAKYNHLLEVEMKELEYLRNKFNKEAERKKRTYLAIKASKSPTSKNNQ